MTTIKRSNTKKNLRTFVFVLLTGQIVVASAEIMTGSTRWHRIRVGSFTSSVDTVIYEAGIPASMGSLPGVTADPYTVSTNAIGGGDGAYTVRIVTVANARDASRTPLTGVFRYDSSSPMVCITAATCGSNSISFTHINWLARDSDTLNTVLQYDASASQVFQTQIDIDPASDQFEHRHANAYQFRFANDQLIPAGTYEGTVRIIGEATW